MTFSTTITASPNIPVHRGDRITIHESNGRGGAGGRTIYTAEHHLSDDTRTVTEFYDGKQRTREVIERSYWAATVERQEPVWKVKKRIRQAVAEEMRERYNVKFEGRAA